MSHFVVLVVGQDPEKLMAPFHQFECTGMDDKYVQNIDITEESRKEYEGYESNYVALPKGVNLLAGGDIKIYTHPEHGLMVSAYDDLFAAPNNKNHFSSDNKYIYPEGYVKIKIFLKDIMSFKEFMEDWNSTFFISEKELRLDAENPYTDDTKYGYGILNDEGEVVKIIRRTNPNYKWDYFRLGGRWGGYFQMKPNVIGISGKRDNWDSPKNVGFDKADQAFKGDIDFDRMREDARVKAEAEWAKYWPIAKDLPRPVMWAECVAHMETLKEKQPTPSLTSAISESKGLVVVSPLTGITTWPEMRDFYHAQPAMKAFKDHPEWSDYWGQPADDMGFDHEAYVNNRVNAAGIPFAVLYKGEWIQRGEMGWFGSSTEEVPEDEWHARVRKLIDDLPDTELLSVMDCHI